MRIIKTFEFSPYYEFFCIECGEFIVTQRMLELAGCSLTATCSRGSTSTRTATRCSRSSHSRQECLSERLTSCATSDATPPAATPPSPAPATSHELALVDSSRALRAAATRTRWMRARRSENMRCSSARQLKDRYLFVTILLSLYT